MSKRLYSRPADKSLEAFKHWILEMTSFLTGDEAADDMTPAEWERSWKEFWEDDCEQQGACPAEDSASENSSSSDDIAEANGEDSPMTARPSPP